MWGLAASGAAYSGPDGPAIAIRTSALDARSAKCTVAIIAARRRKSTREDIARTLHIFPPPCAGGRAEQRQNDRLVVTPGRIRLRPAPDIDKDGEDSVDRAVALPIDPIGCQHRAWRKLATGEAYGAMRNTTASAERLGRYRRGRLSEWLAAAALLAKGYRILGRRVRTPYGE